VAIGVKNKQELDVDIAIFENNYSDEMEKTLQLTEKKLFYRRDLCSMCLKCVEFCQFGAISYDKENDCIVINKDKCVTCGYCVANCPELAIRIL
jgi:ferredoxin